LAFGSRVHGGLKKGKRSERPKLAEALKACRLRGAKLIIAKLDRLARNVAFIKELNGRGISAPRGGEWSGAQVRAVMARVSG
jgi:hypothetical protein